MSNRKRGSIALARQLCYEIAGATSEDDMDGGGYGSVDIAEILSAEVVRLQKALAQPEAEPVAWMFQHDETGRMNYVSNNGIHNPTTFIEMNPRYALVCPLYTAPPQQQAEPVQENKTLIEWKEQGEKIMAQAGVGFRLGAWWADRPWRQK